MNATLSTRQLRVVGLLVLFVVAVGGYLVVARHKSTNNTPTTASSTPAVTTHTQTTPAPGKAHSHAATPVKLDTHGLPVPVALALRKHSVVVVALYSPHSDVDLIAGAEAKAGALAAGAGFVPVNVFHQRPGSAILHKLGLVDTPDILVVKRPGLVYSKFPGFVDLNVVEQAVADAR